MLLADAPGLELCDDLFDERCLAAASWLDSLFTPGREVAIHGYTTMAEREFEYTQNTVTASGRVDITYAAAAGRRLVDGSQLAVGHPLDLSVTWGGDFVNNLLRLQVERLRA